MLDVNKLAKGDKIIFTEDGVKRKYLVTDLSYLPKWVYVRGIHEDGSQDSFQYAWYVDRMETDKMEKVYEWCDWRKYTCPDGGIAKYKTNRREYNRIEKLSLRSRTGREKRTVEGVTLSGDTLVFLKTNFRKVFFLVSETAKELSVLDALKYFKASTEEQPVERIEQHYKHINMALQKFRAMQDEETQETSQDTQATLGAQVSTAVNLLNNFIREIDDNELYLKIVQLKTLAERGVITYIPKRLQRIQKDLRRTSGKSRMTHDEALAEIIEMAKKYSAYYMAQESQLNEQETNAEIILSESFK